MKEFCGEIQYETAEGIVHSDICWHDPAQPRPNYREFLHRYLDEWLDKANGTGAFWVGDPNYFKSWEKE